jgi:tripartite-type tricarboxylate transporter receptor subunit TctC
MCKMFKLLSLSVLSLAGAGWTWGAVAADEYPSKPIRFIAAQAPGGPVDVMARLVGQKVSEALSQPVVVENRQGAGGNIGTAAVARMAPDGYIVLVQSSAFAVNATLFEKPGYDALKDFEPIINSGLIPNIIFVHPSVPANNLAELVALAKQKKMSYASPGIGTTPHLTGELLLKTMLGLDLTHVPFNGAGPSTAVVLANQVPIGSAALIAPMPLIKAGKLRPIIVTSLQRAPQLPDVPTVAESGFAGYQDYTWVGFWAPAGTPKAIVNRLNKEISLALQRPDMKERLSALGYEFKPNTPEEFASFVAGEVQKWGKVVKASGAKVD